MAVGSARLFLVLPLALTALAGCEQRAPGDDLATATRPIVNGQLESGWPGVGALTATYPFYGYQGEFCTGTLITPSWVLTAAHCVYEEDGSLISPSNTRFFTGTDARPSTTTNGPINGTLYAVDAIHPHAQYNDQSLANDIALVHLAQPLTTVATYGVNATFPVVNSTATYVGFGATEGVNSSGSGQKRITTFPISYVYPNEGVYLSDFNTTGTCFGDSGGPGLQQLGGVWKVVGVTSAGVGCNPQSDPNCDPDPCRRATLHTRVDWYASWIAQITNTTAPTCQQNPGMCACAAACQANGQCNNAACQTGDCASAYTCLSTCTDSACQNGCYDSATPTAQGQLDALFTCMDQHCANASAANYGACVQQYCGPQVDACFPVGNGPWTCSEVYDCLVDCPSSDNTCGTTCYEQGTVAAQNQLDVLLDCLDTKCGTLSGTAYQDCASQQCGGPIDACFPTLTGDASCEVMAACIVDCPANDSGCPYACYETGTAQAQDQYDTLLDCAQTKCGTLDGDAFTACYQAQCVPELDVCFPPSNCPITGGDCPTGSACYPTLSGKTDCLPSAGKSVDALCVDSSTTLACGDGLVCADGRCQRFCQVDAHCGANRTCELPVDPAMPTFGSCSCVDADQDGACAADDCNDQDAATRPGVAEACGDSRDNNCNGQTDEGCTGCVDADQDGYCVGVDCNDGDAAIHPTAGERCGNSQDDDCDGQTDEDCATCVDADQDGYCVGVDCNDADHAINPGAAEVCGDGQDNNCSGASEEGCTVNPDPDADATPGSDTGPGTDTGTTSGSRGGDSGCAAAGADLGGALLALLALGLIALRQRRRAGLFG